MLKDDQVVRMPEVVEDVETKMLGAHVEQDLYWAFKQAAAGRNEPLKLAIRHAAMMYIDAAKGESV